MQRTNTAVWYENQKRWQIKVQKNGVRRTFTSSLTGRKGKTECHRKADEWLDDNITDTNKKVSYVFDRWIEELTLTTSNTHVRQYKSYNKNWISPNIGNVRMCDLTEQHLQIVINKAYKKGLSKKTISNIKACMCSFLKYCRKCRYTSLISENLYIPRNAKKGERTVLQPKDIKILFSSDKTTRFNKEIRDFYINAYRFAVATGLRPGELIGLQWNDINGRIIRTARSINIYNEVTNGKNENAKRSFALTDTAFEIITAQRALLDEYKIKSKFVFCNIHGEHIKENNLYKRWCAYRDYNGLSKCTPYELRHTFVSVNKNLPLSMLKSIVGHSITMDTLATYGHELDGEKENIAKAVNDTFKKII